MVKALADSAGISGVTVEQVAKPGYALEDHWYDGQTRNALAEIGWDYVILQQGPSALPENRVHLRHWAGMLAAMIREGGGTPALFAVWPDISRSGDFPAAAESYRLAARDVEGALLRVNEAWQAAWRRDPSLALYGPDGLHPSQRGSYLAALTIFGALYHRSVLGLPRGLDALPEPFQLPALDAQRLQEAADEVNGFSGSQ
jgi:hypothetical protein